MQPNVHDALFKSAFSQVEHAAGELRLILPPALVARLDLTTLVLLPGSFVDEVLKERSSDLLFSVDLAGRPALVYVLFEHQSSVDELMVFRLLRYEVRIWEAHLAGHPNAKKIPAILPVVLHHSAKGWTAATSFEDVLDVDGDTFVSLAAHVPRFRFLLDDISDASDESLQARAMTAFARLVLFCLRHAREPDRLVDHLGRWIELVREVRRSPNGRAALAVLWRYILVANERTDPDDFVRRLVAAAGQEAEEDIVSIADQLEERGRQKGILEGERKGQREGLWQRQRMDLLKLLRSRFGALPESALAQVDGADAATLERWFDHALAAPTLDDVLGHA